MKRWLAILTVVLAGCGPTDSPDGTLQLDKLRGQWVVINYWAVWCKPCIQEIPELNHLDKLPLVTVLGVNYDGAAAQALQEQVEKLGIAFPVLATDPADQLGIERPVVLPTTLILDPEGQLRQTLVGPQTLQSLARATEQPISPERHE